MEQIKSEQIKEQKEMDCKQEERINDLEKSKTKPIVTVMKNLLINGYTLQDMKNELGDEYHIIPVLNQEAIKVRNGEEARIFCAKSKDVKESELKASDFPCISYGKLCKADKNQIVYFDDAYLYIINENIKTSIKLSTIQKCNFDADIKIKIEKCKLSDIKPGDYFIFENLDKNKIVEYNYCISKNNNRWLATTLYCEEGLINKRDWVLTKSNFECKVYRFTIK